MRRSINWAFLTAALLVTNVALVCAQRMPDVLELAIQTEMQKVPPYVPVQVSVQVKNVSGKDLDIFSDWTDGMHLRISQDGKLLGEAHNARTEGGRPIPLPAKDYFEVLFVLQWGNRKQHSEKVFLSKPGEYSLQAISGYTLWNAKTESLEYPKAVLQSNEVSLTVRPPTEAERGAVDLLAEHPAAVRMMRATSNRQPGQPDVSPEGTRVLKQLVERFPNTLHADFANFALGKISHPPDNGKGLLPAERSLASHLRQLDYLSSVGKRSKLLHQRATLLKYAFITQEYQHHTDADWAAILGELEALRGQAELIESAQSYSRYKGVMRWAKALAEGKDPWADIKLGE